MKPLFLSLYGAGIALFGVTLNDLLRVEVSEPMAWQDTHKRNATERLTSTQPWSS